jgi:hypothetical protein
MTDEGLHIVVAAAGFHFHLGSLTYLLSPAVFKDRGHDTTCPHCERHTLTPYPIHPENWRNHSMSTQHASRLGTCPHCHTAITASHVLIEYETSDGQEAVWAECPECREVVDPV